MTSIIIRYVAPSLAAILITWFGKSYITNLYQKADGYDQAKKEVEIQKATHDAKLAKLSTDLESVKQTAKKSDERREHWRQSYYKVKDEYSDYVKEWGVVPYPDDID